MRAAATVSIVILSSLSLSPAAPDPDPLFTKKQIEKDLKLIAVVKSGNRITAGTTPHIELALMNTSKTVIYPVVKPGDGSEVGWREPYVYFTAEQRRVDAKWQSMERASLGRCGLFDWDWAKDVINLKPGQRLPLDSWIANPQFDFQYPGKVRLTAHYAYRATGGKDGKPREEDARGAMKGVPLFEVVSEPMEFEVVRPLDVKIKVKKPLKVGAEMKLSDVIEVTVTNTTDKPITITSPTKSADARLTVWSAGSEMATTPSITEDSNTYGVKRELQPGKADILLGPGDLANGTDGTWRGLKPGTVTIQVQYVTSTWKPGASIKAYANVPVEP